MARLNEVPAPAAESVEALKRRFIRQNREIARVNSNQSIRIRNLETEISRLLAENIAIREEAINARTEAEKWRASHRLNKEVLRMKEQLEIKLCEVSDLVGELGALPEKIARRSSQRRRHGGLISELVKPNEERESRQRHTISEQEGRLPAILEDKHYPRQTLEIKDIQALIQGDNDEATESPDLGPPPVTHFGEPEVVMFNAARSPRRTSMELIEESEQSSRISTTNVDSRRKRRTTTLLGLSAADTVREEADLTIPEPTKQDLPNQPRPILKTGAKRKLEACELEDTRRVSKELDDFIFQRKATSAPTTGARQSRFSRPSTGQNPENGKPMDDRSPERLMQPARRILAPKSTNSPTKRSLVTAHDKLDVSRDEQSDNKSERRAVSRIRAKPLITIEARDGLPKQERNDLDIEDVDDQIRLAPKTPAIDTKDIMSPISTEPSTKQRLPREMAVSNSVEDVLNGSIGRGTKRARAPVNYAQPNLRDKMRRPGKELVGAVEGLVKSQTDSDQEKSGARGDSVDLESAKQIRSTSASTGEHGGRNSMTAAKNGWQPLERHQGGKSEPASPLRDKVALAQRRSDHDTVLAENELSSAVSRLSVFDPLKSSPVGEGHDASSAPSVKHELTHRTPLEDTSAVSGTSIPRKRMSSASGTRPDETEESQRRGHVRKSASVTNLPPMNPPAHRRLASTSRVNVPSESAQSDTLEPRTRSSALTRRKSMMV